LRSGSNCLRLVSTEALFEKETQGISTYTTTGWAVDDFEYAIEIRDPYVPVSKQQEGPSVGKQIKTIAELVEIISKKRWSVARIVSGPRMLQFLFWRKCRKLGIEILGYALNEEEIKRHGEIVDVAISS
jgi:hypothetical protein